jgi:hypothetical protein
MFMSQEFAKIDIPSLTKAAESLDGCTVRAAITNLGFEERWKVLSQIQDENEKHRQTDSSLPQLYFEVVSAHARGPGTDEHMFLQQISSYPWQNPMLYSDILQPQKGTHLDQCSILSKPAG